MKNLPVSSIVGCVADKQGLLLMANLLQDGELLYHVDKKVCEVDRFTSARTSFTSPIYRSSKNSSHQATQIVTKCCRSVLQYFSAVRDRSRKNFQSTGRWSSAGFFFCTRHLRVVNWLHVWTRYWNVLHHFIGDQLPLKIPELSSLS